MAESQPLALLSCRNHFKRLPSPYDVRQQRVTAVKDMRDSVDLVLSERDLGVDSHKAHVTAVVLTRTCAVELLVIQPGQLFTPVGIIPNPVRKSLLDKLLLALRDCRLLFIEHSSFLSVLILDIVEDPHILQVQRLFHDLIAVDPARAIGVVRLDIASVVGFALYIPFARVLREVNVDIPLAVSRCSEQFKHELLHDFRGKPSCAKSDGNLTGSQINRLHRFQRSHILGIVLRIKLCAASRPLKLLPDVSGKVFVGWEVLRSAVIVARVHGIQEDDALQILEQFLLAFAGQLHHIGHVDLGFFRQRQGIRFRSCINGQNRDLLLDGSLGEHICFTDEVALVVQHFQRRKQAVRTVRAKGGVVRPRVDQPILFTEIVVEFI